MVSEKLFLGATRIIGELNPVTVRILPDGEAGSRVLLGVVEFPRRFHRCEMPWRHAVFRGCQLLPQVWVLTIASEHDMHLLVLLSDHLSEGPINLISTV